MLEAQFGPEDQGLQEDALDAWERLMRGRGQSVRDFLIDFDIRLNEATGRGYRVNNVTLSRELLKKARLTEANDNTDKPVDLNSGLLENKVLSRPRNTGAIRGTVAPPSRSNGIC